MRFLSKTLPAFALALALFAALPAISAAAPLIVIDPGHGGPYSNANSNGLREKNANLAIAKELRTQLRARGYRVVMTRTTDRAVARKDRPTWNWKPSAGLWSYAYDAHRGIYRGLPKDDLQARVDIANRLGADLFISIHNNGAANRSVRGTETYASPRDPLGKSLARIVQSRVVRRTGLRNRGAHKADFYVCRWSNMPAILVEGAFISSPRDARLLKKAWFRRRIAKGIAEGVHAWYRSKPVKTTTRKVSTPTGYAASRVTSLRQFPNGAGTVVLVRGSLWRDVPSAPALAAQLRAPLIWVESTPSAATLQELARLAPRKLVLVGTDGAFSTESTSRLVAASSVPTSSVDVHDGRNREALAASIAASMTPLPTRKVFIVDASDTAAQLAAAPVAAAKKIPILLASGGRLGPEAAGFVRANAPRISTALLVGSKAGLPSAVAAGIPLIKRYDRPGFAEEAALINASFYKGTAKSPMYPVVADRKYGAAYLSAASYAAPSARPVLPVEKRVLPTHTRAWITNRRSGIAKFEVFDARRSIPPLMEYELRKADR